jgi:hypothetical protein
MENTNKEKEVKSRYQKVNIGLETYGLLEGFLHKVNSNSKRKIKVPDVLSFAIQKLEESDIPQIQERFYTASDRLDLLLEQVNAQNPDKKVSKDELLLNLLNQYQEEHKRSRQPKTQKS